MGKQYKKPPVRPEVARKWLQRYEENEETPPQIAQADGYDVRTVRKQLDLMRQERENREARQTVLRNALERHYADLCSFAKKLKINISVIAPVPISSALQEDPLWAALRQHIPRSPLWKDIERWQNLVTEYDTSRERLTERIQSEAESRTSMHFISVADTAGLIEGIIFGLVFHLQAVARGESGLKDIAYKRSKSAVGVRLDRGTYGLADGTENQIDKVETVFDTLMVEALDWTEYAHLSRFTEEFLQTKKGILEELTKIILRRVVPGRCSYCPI